MSGKQDHLLRPRLRPLQYGDLISRAPERGVKMTTKRVIDQSRVFGDVEFNTRLTRNRFIGMDKAKRRQWLKDHPDEYEFLVQDNASSDGKTSTDRRVELGLDSKTSCQDVPNPGYRGVSGSRDMPARDSLPPASPPLAVEAPKTAVSPATIAKSEITIGGRRHVSLQRLCSMVGKSGRTLSRWCADGNGPPPVKIGGVYFELDKILEWAASRGLTLKSFG
jgi:predicted DNA-binding transcriptional regulator AlpA